MANNKNTNTPPQLFVAVEVAKEGLPMYTGEYMTSKGHLYYDGLSGKWYESKESSNVVFGVRLWYMMNTPSTDAIEQEAKDNLKGYLIKHSSALTHNQKLVEAETDIEFFGGLIMACMVDFATSPAAGAYWLGKEKPTREEVLSRICAFAHRHVEEENFYGALADWILNKCPVIEHQKQPSNTEQLPELSDDEILDFAENEYLHDRNGHRGTFALGMKKYREELRKRQPQNDGWISVEDHYPVPGQSVIGYDGTSVFNCYYRDPRYYSPKAAKFDSSVGVRHNVTHWRPLPPPPTQKQ